MSDTIAVLWRWYSAELREMQRAVAVRGSDMLLLGCPVWGKEYVERFAHYCLPTLASPKNLAALGGRSRLVLLTDQAHYNALCEMLRPLQAWGVDSQVIEIPAEIVALTDKDKHSRSARERNIYHVLGTAQTILLTMAGRLGMSFHMLMTDHMYAQHYFPNVFRIGRNVESIAQIGVTVDIVKAAAEIERFRTADGELTIPDRDLGDIGWRYLHKRIRMFLMNDAQIPARVPNAHYLLWQGHDRLSIYCCHMNPAYLSARLCQAAPTPRRPLDLVATLDTKLPALMSGTVYVPGVDDGMTFIGVDGEKDARPSYVTLREFVATSLRQVGFSPDYMPFFQQVCEIPIHPQETYAPAELIKAQHAALVEAIQLELRPSVALEALQAMFGSRYPTPQPQTVNHGHDRAAEGPGQQAEDPGEGEAGRRAQADGGRARRARADTRNGSGGGEVRP